MWVKTIEVEGSLKDDLLWLIDEYYSEHGTDAFPVKLYEYEELDEFELETYIPLNGGEYYLMGISHIEEC